MKFINDKWCNLFTGPLTKKGYGVAWKYGTNKAHRIAYMDTHGPIPKGQAVLHHCDVRHCIEPAHLYLGTQVENMADMVERDRANKPKGEKNGRAVLTEADVRHIRSSHFRPETLAKYYSVTVACIKNALTKKSWSHID